MLQVLDAGLAGPRQGVGRLPAPRGLATGATGATRLKGLPSGSRGSHGSHVFIALYKRAPWTTLMVLHGQLMNTLSNDYSQLLTLRPFSSPQGISHDTLYISLIEFKVY
jgi:hypothetical protein